MPYKICPSCQQTSYSAAGDNIWICPCCGEDISLISGIGDRRSILSLHKNRSSRLADSAHQNMLSVRSIR